jgi:anti-sigma regulatory factor (Ser/Thr protein kinase)
MIELQDTSLGWPEPPERRPSLLSAAAPPTVAPGAPAPTDPGDSERALHLALTPVASALGPARDSARLFLRGFNVPEPTVFDIVLSLEEACKNAIRFSGSRRDIDVTVAVTTREVRFVIRDHGVGFNPPDVDISSTPDLSDPRGRGLFLIHCLMDDVRIACDDGAIVTARKAVTH